jgi:hypothetical protein
MMAIDHASYERLLEYRIPEIQQTLTMRDSMLYALGVGLGADPVDERQLRFVYERNLLALPTMAVVSRVPYCMISALWAWRVMRYSRRAVITILPD